MQLGSEFRARTKRDPQEKQIDDEFRSRKYTRDADGHIHMEVRNSTSSRDPNSEDTDQPLAGTSSQVHPPKMAE